MVCFQLTVSVEGWKRLSVLFSTGAEETAAAVGSGRASLGSYGCVGKQGSCLLAPLSRHVLQTLCVESIEVQPERQKADSSSASLITCPKQWHAASWICCPGPLRAYKCCSTFVRVLAGSKGFPKHIDCFTGHMNFRTQFAERRGSEPKPCISASALCHTCAVTHQRRGE